LPVFIWAPIWFGTLVLVSLWGGDLFFLKKKTKKNKAKKKKKKKKKTLVENAESLKVLSLASCFCMLD
jgi:hypothetical protein